MHSTFGLPYLLTEENLIESSPLLAPNDPAPEILYEPAPKILDFSLTPIASPDFVQIKTKCKHLEFGLLETKFKMTTQYI